MKPPTNPVLHERAERLLPELKKYSWGVGMIFAVFSHPDRPNELVISRFDASNPNKLDLQHVGLGLADDEPNGFHLGFVDVLPGTPRDVPISYPGVIFTGDDEDYSLAARYIHEFLVEKKFPAEVSQ